MIRVLLATTSYPAGDHDWQGRFIADMVAALAAHDDLALDLWGPVGSVPQGVTYATTDGDAAWLARMAAAGGIAHLLRKRGPLALLWAAGLLRRLSKAYQRSAADVMHINWIQNALALPAGGAPTLITVLGSDYALLRLPGMVPLVRRLMKRRRVMLAPNAEWMTARLEQAFGDLATVRAIPFGIAHPWYGLTRTPGAAASRAWLAVTRLTRPKLGPLFEWGAPLFRDGHQLHLFGPRQDSSIAIPDWVHYHGPTHPAELQASWFPRAAGLITLSQHDEGRPQVMLEAMAAGLPVIASGLPAHRDVVRHGVTGLLVETVGDVRQALDTLGDAAENLRMGHAARQITRDRLGTWDDCAGRYVDAYRTLLEGT